MMGRDGAWVGQGASPVYHGGDLAQVRARFPEAPQPWIDLSTGINPTPYPLPPIPAEAWTRLPEAHEVERLEAIAATAFGVDDPAGVAATPGTQALIQMLPRLIGGARVGILGFTYQEHARVWREAEREVVVVDTVEALATCDVGLVVNPNNPDGQVVPPGELAALALDMSAAGRRLIVDEAFVDVLEEGASLAPRLPLGGTIVLRSFGKTWGLAGVRLGFCVGDARFAGAVRRAFGPWAVPGPAVAIGAAALADRPWLEATRARLDRDAARLDAILAAAGCRVLGGTSLFRLVDHADGGRFADRLAAAGIHVRRFPHDDRLLRLGLPGEETAWERLQVASR
jgi:cobalamin biosynthetic protein CobC